MNNIVVAPFSNSDIRDWPGEHYARMIALVLDRWEGTGMVRVVGTKTQAMRACDIVRHLDPMRVSQDCGRLPWPDVVAEIRAAACVIGNNSGIAHLAGMYGVPTVCVFGGSHQRLEWRPIGRRVVTLTRAIGCSPCHLDHGMSCPYDKACLRQITPESVADAVFLAMEPGAAGEAAPSSRAA